MERYPENIDVTLEDFKKCGWHEAVNEAKHDDYHSMWDVLSKAAKQSIEEKCLSEGKALWLLADACSMVLRASSLNEPFAPFFVMAEKRSVVPEDFQEADIVFFEKVVSEIDNPRLCARISDLVWLLKKPRDFRYALSAIDNYYKIPISTEVWSRGGKECWDRAIQLCLMLKGGAGNRLMKIETSIIESIKGATDKDGYLTIWLSELVAKYRLCRNDQDAISNKLYDLAKTFKDEKDLNRSKDYFDAAADCFRRNDDLERSVEMIVRSSEVLVEEAKVRQATNFSGNTAALSFFESAIQKLRTIPRSQRSPHNVDSIIDSIRGEMNTAGKYSLEEMGVVSSNPIDLSEVIENAIESVRGKSTLDALLALANVSQGVRVDRLRNITRDIRKKFPLQFLFAATQLSVDGRVVAKQPSVDLVGENGDSNLWPDMVKHYTTELSLIVQGQIWPALEAVRLEHRITELDFYSIVRESPIVPPDRKRLLSKAIYSGYDNDFVTALHLLVPQIEHLVRFHLKQRGIKTTNIDSNGIENENGLGTLVENDGIKEIFGDDLSFELKALFCSPFGPNLRNELAHGLLGYEQSQSIYSIYSWWLSFRIILNTFWNAKRAINDEHKQVRQ